MDKVFIPRAAKAQPSFPVGTIFSRSPVKGDIGLEIEVEGNKFPKDESAAQMALIPKQWKYTHDGSLRGEDNAEYILRNPVSFDEVEPAVRALWQMFTDYGSVLDESNRTSVHVHLNVQNWHLNRLCAFFCLYFSVEEILTEWCGEHRVGNLFCLRAKDASAIVTRIKRFLQTEGNEPSLSEGMHYSAMNAYSMVKFGSLEIRTMRGVQDPDTIIQWVEILRRIYNMSDDYKDPRHIMERFSGEGPLAYLETVFGPHLETIRSGIDFDDQRIMGAVYDGIRFAQDLAYCRNWSEFKAMDIKPDPFGRKIKTSQLNELAQAAAAAGGPAFGTVVSTASHDDIFVMAQNALAQQETAATAPAPVQPPQEWIEPDVWFDDEDFD